MNIECPLPQELSPQQISEAKEHFKNILRIDSRNPDSNEAKVCDYLEEVLKSEGIASTIIEPKPGRKSIIARLNGDGKRKPLLLTGHTDVVPFEEEKWNYHPLSAQEAEGFIWGRGAIDMKHHVIYCLMSLLFFKRLGVLPKRDIIFAGVADEEAGCTFGSKFITENHPELVRAEYALNEVGGFPTFLAGKVYYPIQVSEKGFCWIQMTAHGNPGHGSMPHPENAILKLAKAITSITKKPMPVQIVEDVKVFIEGMADVQIMPVRKFLKSINNPHFTDLVINRFPPDKRKAFHAMTRNTVSPTILSGGNKSNVIPSSASVTLDCRLLPGQTNDDILTELRSRIENDSIELTIINSGKPSRMRSDTPLFRLICNTIEQDFSKAIAVPYMTVGFTDACYYQNLGITVYGFSPCYFPPDIAFSDLFHGHNERISTSGFEWGMDIFYRVVKQFITEE